MSLKLLLLKNGDELVSDVKSVKDEDGKKVYSYILTNPMKLETEGDDDDFLLEGDEDYQVARINEYEEELTLSMTRWPRFTEQDKIYLSPEWVVTLVDPIPQLAEITKKIMAMKKNQVLCILLKNLDLVLISKVNQFDIDALSGEADTELTDPVRILCEDEESDVEKRLVRWPGVTDQKVLSMHSDDILTLVEPNKQLLTAYENFIKE
jgi:hypothetical protein